MRVNFPTMTQALGAAGILLTCGLMPGEALACACGCSVFDVGTTALLPKEDDHGGVVYFEWDHSDQNIHWAGTSKGAGPNPTGDVRIATDWYVVGANYMINRDWGFGVRIPTASRSFTSDQNVGNTPPDYVTAKIDTIGDIELTGMYTGFSKDMSKGVIFGVKLPTGPWKADGFDRDTQISPGSTDLILGGFLRGMITGDNAWQYFAQTKLDLPVLTHSVSLPAIGQSSGDYRPGTSLDTAVGITYNNWYHVGPFDKVAPLLQVITSIRQPDSGAASDPADTGYSRVFISPGIDITKVVDEANNRTFKLYGDVEIPVYTHVNGDQQVAPYIFKIVAGYTF
jgi:hypothetical protein